MAEAHLDVQFYLDTKENPSKSVSAGRPIFDEVEMVRIRIAGDKGTDFHAPAHMKATYVREGIGDPGRRISYVERFPAEYEAFKRGISQAVTGTPIEEAPFLTMANRAELKAVNVFTVEALAGLEKTEKLGMQGAAWRDQARAYLERAKGSAVDGKLIAETQNLKAEIENLKAMLASKGAEAPEPEEAVDEVDKPGPFFGYTAKMLREFIKEKSGAGVKGNPKLETLLSMAEDLVEAVE